MKDASLGYARTFVTQVEDCLGLALEKGVRIVSNAGGLNPAGLADRLREVAAGLGLDAKIAHVDGDNLSAASGSGTTRSPPTPTSAASASPRALEAGADIVVTGRVTDASLVVGPAVAHHGWDADAVRRAGRRRGRRPRPRVRHPGHRRQLLRLPRAPPRRATPARLPARRDRRRRQQRDHQARRHRRLGHRRHRDRAADLRDPDQPLPRPRRHHDLDTITLDPGRRGPGARSPACAARRRREQLKVCVNELGGFRNQMEFVLTGLDLEDKADWLRAQLEPRLDRRVGHLVDRHAPRADADTEEGASCLLRVHGEGPAGRRGGQGVHRARRSSSRSAPTPASR